jgi:F-type H+-transporting ATPase subunit alpha
MPIEEQVISLFAGMRGYLDKIAVADIGRFEAELLRLMRGKHADVLNEIRSAKTITPESETKLKTILENFAGSFA